MQIKNDTILARLKSLPHKPGVYLMLDSKNKIIYIGKAKDLKNRVSSYFINSPHDPKTLALVSKIADIQFFVTKNEIEALILEDTLIKKHQPRYNILLKDDKRYPFLKLTIQEDYPRLIITRERKNDNNIYFGPFTSVKPLRESYRLIHKIFPIRKCRKNLKIKSKTPPYFPPVGNYCLYYQIKQCLAPCQGNISPEEYKSIVENVLLFLKGKNKQLIDELTKEMNQAAENLQFEKAALIRDRIKAIEKIMEKQRVVSSRFESKDVIVTASKDGFINFTVIFVREGKITGKTNFIQTQKFHQEQPEFILSEFLREYYSSASFLPEEILIENQIEDMNLIEEWIKRKFNIKIKIKVPEDQQEKDIIQIAKENCEMELATYLLDIKTRDIKKSLRLLKEKLGLKKIPEVIEGFDISNIGGEFAVGSMVKFINGEPVKSEYRKFKIKTVEGIDDYSMMKEIVYRRYKRLMEENKRLPELILIDGGKGHLSSAIEGLREAGIRNIPIISLAKKEELIFKPGESGPLKLSRRSPALKLLQNIRDEAHRFAIQYHRSLRDKKLLSSSLEKIKGIGEKTKTELLKHYNSLEEIITSSDEELLKFPGVNKRVIKEIRNLLK